MEDMRKMRKRSRVIYAMMCAALMMSGCSNDKGVNSDDAGKADMGSAVSEAGAADENGSLLAQQLGIPGSVQMDLPADGTNLKKITLDDKDVIVPDRDRMYTKSYRMGILTDETREEIVKSFLDESDGIYNYPEELFNEKDKDRESVEQFFEDNSGEKPDYSGEYFIGKIDGEPYVVRFMDTSWSIDEAVAVSRVCKDEVTDEMAAKQISSITYYDYNPDVLKEESTEQEDGTDEESANSCGMNKEETGKKAADDMAAWGFNDVVQTSITDMYKAYEGDHFNVLEYDKDGYTVRFDASVNDVTLYQPMTLSIDTIVNPDGEEGGLMDTSRYYSSERSYYTLSFNEDGLMDFYGYWPMRSDDDLHPVDHLITWDEAVDGLKKAIPDHFAGYKGYSEVKFNDVRLAYFRTKTGDKEYEIIPVYVFAQMESWAEEDNAPDQLLMIDARDGSEVDVRQDPARQGIM